MDGRSYKGGMNQALNFVFGSALVGWMNHHVTDDIWWCLVVAVTVFFFWKVWQSTFRRATVADYISDVVYWFSGVFIWAILIEYSQIEGVAVMYPTLILCVWVLEHKRLST